MSGLSVGQGGHAAETAEDSTTADPTQIFIPGPIISDDDEFGTLISGTVADGFVDELGTRTVTIRILPIGRSVVPALRDAVRHVSETYSSPFVLKYVGVWEVSLTETWLVSERKQNVSVGTLMTNVWSSDTESLIAYIAMRTIAALKSLHDQRQHHGYLRPLNIYVDEKGNVSFGDVGIYDVVSEALSSRRSLPGIKLWPVEGASERPTYLCNEDLWDLGIALLVLADGGASVARLWRSGRRLPRLSNPSRWSAQFNSFLGLIFSRATDSLPLTEELLNHRFVAGVSSTAFQYSMREYLSTRDELRTENYVHDTISTLFLQNIAVVRAPLISIDDISSDQFAFENWNSGERNRPTVEMSLLRVLQKVKEQPVPRGAEEYKSLSHTTGTVEAFLETADMLLP